jgi:hypothetical protein
MFNPPHDLVPFSRPSRKLKGDRMGFTYSLELQEGTPADPPILNTAVPNWNAGDTIPLPAGKTPRVVVTQFDEDEPVLVVQRS